jgi:homoserine O-acetyltransferase/O-succinyltransferase
VNIETHTKTFTNPLYLESGRILEPYSLTYETYGTLNEDKSNVIVVCHALTGSHHAAGYYEDDRKAGWWNDLIGEDKAIDTENYFVICCNVIGSCFGSTGPSDPMYPQMLPYRFKFPVVTVKDMVKAQRMLFDSLGINHVYAIVGGSMGGMQALHFAVDYPNFADKIVALATTHATQPWAIAFNKIAIESIRNDPEFDNGNYDFDKVKENGMMGAAIGRMGGHISFLSPDSMNKKFGRNYALNDGLFELFGRFEIERYLDYNGNNFPTWFDPLTFLYIAKAINIYDISRGYDSLEDALKEIKSELHLFSFDNDMLFLKEESLEIVEALQNINHKNYHYYPIESDYGHDAFLVEVDKFDSTIRNILGE